MKKSVYSLVLMDEVVEAVDRMAYAMGTSRSNLINQILAEKVSYITPEMRMNDIFSCIQDIMTGDAFQITTQPSDTMLSIRSALKYKYKPTIRYSLELFRNNEKTFGELRVSFRTQSAQLISCLTDFLNLWANLENAYIVQFFPEGIRYSIENGKFVRKFRLPKAQEQQTTENIGKAVAEYIQMFDEILKVYFAGLDNPKKATADVKAAYEGYLKKGIEII